MNWAHVHQTLLSVTQQQINPILISTLEVLFGKFEISELHSNLFKAYYLSQTNQFTIVQIQLALSHLNDFKQQYPPNALYDILESIVILTKQQLLKNSGTNQLQTHVYHQLLRSPKSKRNKSSTPKQRQIDYSYLKLTNHKRQKTAFNDLISNVDVQDANAKIDNYKQNKSTDTTQIALRQMPKSKLHNYYVKVMLRDIDPK